MKKISLLLIALFKFGNADGAGTTINKPAGSTANSY
jgi:hypothetical protein